MPWLSPCFERGHQITHSKDSQADPPLLSGGSCLYTYIKNQSDTSHCTHRRDPEIDETLREVKSGWKGHVKNRNREKKRALYFWIGQKLDTGGKRASLKAPKAPWRFESCVFTISTKEKKISSKFCNKVTFSQTIFLQQVHSRDQTTQNQTIWLSYSPSIGSLPGNANTDEDKMNQCQRAGSGGWGKSHSPAQLSNLDLCSVETTKPNHQLAKDRTLLRWHSHILLWCLSSFDF